jgi:hypothetical protein
VSAEQPATRAVTTAPAPGVEEPAAPTLVPAPVLRRTAAPRLAGASEKESARAVARVQAVAGQLVPYLQYQLTRLGVAGQAGLAALAAAAAVTIGALIPAYQALQTLNTNLLRAQHPAAVNSIEQAVPRLVASLPTRGQIPAVLGQVYAAARASGVPLNVGHYSYSPAKTGAIAHYDLEFPVKAGYPEIRAFINRTLTAVPAASLSKLHIERKAVGDPVVSADVGFVVFVRSAEGP